MASAVLRRQILEVETDTTFVLLRRRRAVEDLVPVVLELTRDPEWVSVLKAPDGWIEDAVRYAQGLPWLPGGADA